MFKSLRRSSALSTITRAMILPVVLFLAVLVSQCTTLNPLAFAQYADGPIKYPWSDQPEYQSDYQKSQEQQFNERTRENRREWDREQEAYRQESLRQYREGSSGSNSLGYTPPSVTILPNGKHLTCYPPTRGNPLTVCY